MKIINKIGSILISISAPLIIAILAKFYIVDFMIHSAAGVEVKAFITTGIMVLIGLVFKSIGRE